MKDKRPYDNQYNRYCPKCDATKLHTNGRKYWTCLTCGSRTPKKQANTGLHTDSGKTLQNFASLINSLAWIIIDSTSKEYISSNDLDFANECLDMVQPYLNAAAGKA